MSAFDQIRDVYFGSARAPMRLSPEAKRRVLWASLAPGIVLAAAVIHAALELTYSDFALYGRAYDSSVLGFLNFDILGGYGEQAPRAVRRLYAMTGALQALEPLALALLFAAGLRRWGRAEGSWMRLIAVSLAGVALAAGAFAVGAYAVLDRADDKDLHIPVWMSLARTFGLMAAGYFFLAYRATQPVRATTRRRRPRPRKVDAQT